MRVFQTFDRVPLWIVFLALVLFFLGAIEVGFRLGRFRRRMPNREGDAPSSAMVAATLGLLGFMLAFTFNMAATRFDARKHLVLDESNAIGTAYLRARLLPDPQSTELQDLLRRYVDVRLLGAERPGDFVRLRTEQAVLAAIAESQRIQNELWTKTEGLSRSGPPSVLTSLFAQSLNDVIDLHGKRVTMGIRFRIPPVIWVTLLVLSLLSMVGLGFHGGVSSPRRSGGAALVTFAFVMVLALIVDLDRGQEGLLQVGVDPLFDVRESMQNR